MGKTAVPYAVEDLAFLSDSVFDYFGREAVVGLTDFHPPIISCEQRFNRDRHGDLGSCERHEVFKEDSPNIRTRRGVN